MKNICLSLLVLLLFASAYPQDSTFNHRQVFDKKLKEALMAIKLTTADLEQRDDYLEKDEYRIQLIDSLMHAPLTMLDISEDLLEGKLPQYSDYIGYTIKDFFLTGNPRDVVKKYTRKRGIDGITMYRLAYFLAGTEDMTTHQLYNKIHSSLLDSLVYGFTLLLEEDTLDEFRSVEELDSIGTYEEDWTKKLTEITYGVGAEVFGMIGQSLLDIFNDAIINDEDAREFKRKYIEFDTQYGKVCIGDDSVQEYTGDIFIVIDYGGDDIYNIRKKGTGNFTYILDYGGNDIYHLPKNRITPYATGANLIIDFDGDDYYDAGSWALGSGFFGCGILWDKKGNDKYYGDTHTMGAGCFGINNCSGSRIK